MIQLNLLPDVKLEYLRSTRQKRLVIGISLLVAAVSVSVVLLLASVVYIFQRNNLNDLNADINIYNSQLKNTPDLDKVLTVQNQLNSLPDLHDQKPVASRLFRYLTQLTPTTASITQIDVNFGENVMTVTGAASSLDVANTFIDTLKFTTWQKAGETESKPPKAFTNVVMSQYSRNNTGANFTITMNFEPAIYDSASEVKLAVPRIISTRSVTEQPTDLFQTQGAQQ